MHVEGGKGHDRTNNNPFFKMVSSRSNMGGDMFGGRPMVHETEIVEKPGPNGTMIEKKYVYDNNHLVSSSSGSGSAKPLTAAQKKKLQKEEKMEEKQEQQMAKNMARITRNIFSDFFSGGRSSSSSSSSSGNGQRSRVEWIPIGRIKPIREWHTTRERRTTRDSPVAKKPKNIKSNASPRPSKVLPAKPKGPVVKHGVVNGLAAIDASEHL